MKVKLNPFANLIQRNYQFSMETIDMFNSENITLTTILEYTKPDILCLCNISKSVDITNTFYKFQLKTPYSIIFSKFPIYRVASYSPHASIYGRPVKRGIECVIIRIDLPTKYNHLLIFTNIPKNIENVPCQTDLFEVTYSHILHCAYREIHDFIIKSLIISQPEKTIILFTGDFATSMISNENEMELPLETEFDFIVYYIRKQIQSQMKFMPFGISRNYLKECGSWLMKLTQWISGKVDGLNRFINEIELYRKETSFEKEITTSHLISYSLLDQFMKVMNVHLKSEVLNELLNHKRVIISFDDFQWKYEPFYDHVPTSERIEHVINKDYMMMEHILEAMCLNVTREEFVLSQSTLQTLIMVSFTKNNIKKVLQNVICEKYDSISNENKKLPEKLSGISVVFSENPF